MTTGVSEGASAPAPESASSAFSRWTIAVFVAVIVLQFAHLVALAGDPSLQRPRSDHWWYLAWGRAIAAGETRSLDMTVQQPAYAFAAAAAYRSGLDDQGLRFLHVVATGAAAALFYRLAAIVVGQGWAVAAVVLGFANPVIVFSGTTWSKEMAALACGLLCLNAWVFRERGWSLVASVALALAAGLREMTLVPILAFVAVDALRRRRLRELAAALAVTIVIAAGWEFAHVRERGETSPQAPGELLYVAFHPDADVHYSTPPFLRPSRLHEPADWRTETERRLGRPVDSREEHRYWLGESLRVMAADPVRTLRLFAARVASAFWAGPAEDNYPYLVYLGLSPVLGALVPPWLVFALGMGGAWTWWASGRRRSAWCAVAALVLGTALTIGPFYLFERFRYALYPAFGLMAVAGIRFLPRVPRVHLAAYAVAVVVAVSPGISRSQEPYIVEGTRRGWMELAEARRVEAARRERRAVPQTFSPPGAPVNGPTGEPSAGRTGVPARTGK